MVKIHETKKITFSPINIEISHDESQGIFFVYLETEPFDYEDYFPVENPKTGKLEGKNEIRKFSHLQFIFNSQKEIDNFSTLVKQGQFYEVETNWSGAGRRGKIGGELKENVFVNNENPSIKKMAANQALILKYFQNEGIKEITFCEGSEVDEGEMNLTIKYNSGKVENKVIRGAIPALLTQMWDYSRTNNKRTLTWEELNTKPDEKSATNLSENLNNKKNDYAHWILGIGGILISGAIFYLFWRGKKRKISK